MTLQALENLVKTGALKFEERDEREFQGLLQSARRALQDARLDGLSEEGRFSLAYGAAHAASLAALRWHSYRSENRYLVFQCLQHTVGLPAEKWRILDLCHRHRNLAEYEGSLDIPDRLVSEMIEVTAEVVAAVTALEQG